MTVLFAAHLLERYAEFPGRHELPLARTGSGYAPGGNPGGKWLCTEDLGAIAARVFAAPRSFVGKELTLASDARSLDECRLIYREVMGTNPRRFPMPVWLLERFGFVGKDLTTMWRWLRTGAVDLDTAPTRVIHPEALTVRSWLGKQRGAGVATRRSNRKTEGEGYT